LGEAVLVFGGGDKASASAAATAAEAPRGERFGAAAEEEVGESLLPPPPLLPLGGGEVRTRGDSGGDPARRARNGSLPPNAPAPAAEAVAAAVTPAPGVRMGPRMPPARCVLGVGESDPDCRLVPRSPCCCSRCCCSCCCSCPPCAVTAPPGCDVDNSEAEDVFRAAAVLPAEDPLLEPPLLTLPPLVLSLLLSWSIDSSMDSSAMEVSLLLLSDRGDGDNDLAL